MSKIRPIVQNSAAKFALPITIKDGPILRQKGKLEMQMSKFAVCLLAPLAMAAARPNPAIVDYTDYSAAFDQFESQTRNMPAETRVAEFRMTFDRIRPGLYADKDPQRLNRRILRSLDEFPALRPAYLQVKQQFGMNLSEAVQSFRRVFPDFTSPLPIILAHELGVRDGGSDYVAGQKVMLFGADMIAKLHNDDSLQPFLEHELFHLEHARYFADCDQFWCPLWQEGLATYAASVMTPGANDHQLLLDQPKPIRKPTEEHWREALCTVATEFDQTNERAMDLAFTGGQNDRSGLPSRFGYYAGLQIAAEAGQHMTLPALTRLDDEHARPVVARALKTLLAKAKAPCAPPPASMPITRHAPRPA